MLEWLKKKQPMLKRLFVISVMVIVTFELLSIGKTLSISQLKLIFRDIAVWKIVLMGVVGFVSVTPMLGYDVILMKLLNDQRNKRYLLENSWMINTINNVAGFGGVVSIGLRSSLYGKGAGHDRKEVLRALSHIFLFLMSGLSIYSFLSFISLWIGPFNEYVAQYWIWLIGGGLYFPLVLIITQLKKSGLLGGLSVQTRLELVGISFLEWTGVLLTFISIGWLMGISFHLGEVIPLFVAATVLGMVSMIPGALGSFDVMMIFGLTSLGIPKESVVAWLLLYRLFYYILPFLVGLGLFVKTWGHTLNEQYDRIPRQLLNQTLHKMVVVTLYLAGILMVLAATVPEAFASVKWLHHFLPQRFHILNQLPSIALGYLLIIMGRGVAARVKKAYIPTLLLIATTWIYALLVDLGWFMLILLAILLILTVTIQSEFVRRQFVYAWEMVTVDSAIMGLLMFFYIGIGVYNLPKVTHHAPFHTFLFFPSEKVWLMGFLLTLIVFFLIVSMIRYLQGDQHVIGEAFDNEKVHTILETYGGNETSHLVFLGDKRLFCYPQEEPTVFIQFQASNNKLIVMGDPSGNEEDFPEALSAFIEQADEWGYLPVFYEITESIVLYLHEYGYDFIKMGEEAHVSLEAFTLTGKKMKNRRAVMNRLTKEGYKFELTPPPFDASFIEECQRVSDAWLDGRKEKGFSLGFFSDDYLQQAPIATIRNTDGQLIAFASMMPAYNNARISIDLMRHDPVLAPSGTMDYLFMNLFQQMKEAGFREFNMGMAPLANVGTSRKSFIQERIAYLVYHFGSRFYSFQGLRDYKSKYATDWQPKYTLYSRDSWIAYVMLSILKVDNASVEKYGHR